jgi:hypothetical protein
MADRIMYQEDAYVVLDSTQPEQEILTAAELQAKLIALIPQLDELPRDVQKFSSVEAQAAHLLTNYCELDVGPGNYLQWYVVRLEK